MKKNDIFYSAFLCAGIAIVLLFFILSNAGCGSLISIFAGCDHTIDPPLPKSSSFQQTPNKKLGIYTDGSGDWDVANISVLESIEDSLDDIVACIEERLDVAVELTIEPAEQVHITESAQKRMTITPDSHKGCGIFESSKTEKRCLSDEYPDEYPFVLQKEQGFEGCHQDDNAATIQRSEDSSRLVVRGTIPSDFLIILIDKDACIKDLGVWGFSGTITDPSTGKQYRAIWINRTGELADHELAHALATFLGLTEEEERTLEACTPGINHKDF